MLHQRFICLHGGIGVPFRILPPRVIRCCGEGVSLGDGERIRVVVVQPSCFPMQVDLAHFRVAAHPNADVVRLAGRRPEHDAAVPGGIRGIVVLGDRRERSLRTDIDAQNGVKDGAVCTQGAGSVKSHVAVFLRRPTPPQGMVCRRHVLLQRLVHQHCRVACPAHQRQLAALYNARPVPVVVGGEVAPKRHLNFALREPPKIQSRRAAVRPTGTWRRA